MPVNDAYLVQVEGWRGAVRQAPAVRGLPAAEELPACPAPKPTPKQVLPPVIRMNVKILDKVGRKAAA